MARGVSAPGAPRCPGDGFDSRSVLPDLLTGSRLVLGPLFAVLLFWAPTGAFVVSGLAAATDFLDGRLARRLGQGSDRGAVLDVVCDAVFVLTGLTALAWAGVLSVALPIAAGSLAPRIGARLGWAPELRGGADLVARLGRCDGARRGRAELRRRLRRRGVRCARNPPLVDSGERVGRADQRRPDRLTLVRWAQLA